MQTTEIIEMICFIVWIVSIVWKYFSKRSMTSLLVQLVVLSSLLFLQLPKILEAILMGYSCKGILFYMAFILINIFVNGYQMEERAKKGK